MLKIIRCTTLLKHGAERMNVPELTSSRLAQLRKPLFTSSMKSLHSTATMRTLPEFDTAKDRVTQLKEEPDNDIKLQLYALFKQSTDGECNKPKPGMIDFVGKAKWQAWTDLGDLGKDSAQHKYIDLVNSLVAAEGDAAPPTQASTYETLLTENRDGIFTITLNRPNKYNAITHQMYNEWIQALEEAANDSSVKAAVTTGAGDFYCSGNDLNNFSDAMKGIISVKESAENGAVLLKKYVKAFIDFPKPLIAAINGPAVGISVTVLGMYDAVFASDKATFHTPFTSLGQSAEGCSTFTFPRIMGNVKACGMLMFNEKITAQEACLRGLIKEVIPHDSFQRVVQEKLTEISQLPKGSLAVTKTVIRDTVRPELHAANERECEALVERWQSQECAEAVMAFATRKSKM